MKYYIVIDSRNNSYKIVSKGFTSKLWTDNIQKAKLFRTKGAATISCYCYSINPNRGKLKAKIILPTWINIIEVFLKVRL